MLPQSVAAHVSQDEGSAGKEDAQKGADAPSHERLAGLRNALRAQTRARQMKQAGPSSSADSGSSIHQQQAHHAQSGLLSLGEGAEALDTSPEGTLLSGFKTSGLIIVTR